MGRFSELPPPLAQHILSLVDGDYVTEVVPHTPRLPVALFTLLSQVSRDWRRLVQQLEELHRVSTVSIHVKYGQATELETLYSAINLRGTSLRSLTIRLGTTEFIRSFDIPKARESDRRMDNDVNIDWNKTFSTCPRLQRLDLSRVPMHSQHLKRILAAASTHCRELKALVMPKREWHRGPVTTEWLPTMRTLYSALAAWHSYGSGNGPRGLVQLCLPQRITRSRTNISIHELADEYLLTVAAYCPDLEYFDGWKDTYQQVDARLLCEELLYCSKPAWLAFCDRCRSIRELNWYVLPFIDDFFDAFGQFTKPNLRRLTLAGGDHLNFNDNAVFGTYYQDGPWNYSAPGVNRIFQGCPALEELQVTFQLPPFDDGTRQDTVTDSFLESLAAHCPKLRSLVIAELFDADFYGSIEGVTDKGIRAIASLQELRDIRLKATRCQGAGVASLIQLAPTDGSEREVKMVIGEDSSQDMDRYDPYYPGFYEILAEALGILLHTDPAELQQRRVRINLQGHYRVKPINALWRGTAHRLKDMLCAQCPWLHVEITERHRQVVAVLTSNHRETRLSDLKQPPSRTLERESDEQWWPQQLWSKVLQFGRRLFWLEEPQIEHADADAVAGKKHVGDHAAE